MKKLFANKKSIICCFQRFVLMAAVCLAVLPAFGQTQKLTLIAEGETLISVFTKLEKQTGYKFIYNRDEMTRKLSMKATNSSMREILDAIAASTGIKFTIDPAQKRVIIDRGTSQPAPKVQGKSISGTIKDKAGQPLPGATVYLKGTSRGTTADVTGKFTLTAPESGELVFSYIGYLTQVVPVGTRTMFNITLREDMQSVDEIVVIGYGSVKKSDLTGSVANVKMSDVQDVPVLAIDQALQGRIAGADIMSTSGEPGATTSIRIRGTRSISANNEPLIVVDGVIDGVHDLNDINAADIESVSVLKDASSTAIYGTRGSNGVILVTTKRGKEGRTSVTFRTDLGFAQLPKGLEIMNATEFALYRNDYAYFSNEDSYQSIGPNTPLSQYPYPDPYSKGKGTDWIDQVSQTAPYQNYNLSVSGGTKSTKYFGSFSYNDARGIIKKSGLVRYTGRFNIDHEFSKYVRAGMRLNYSHRKNDTNVVEIGGTSYWRGAMFLSPMIKVDSNFNDLWYTGDKFNSPQAYIDNVTDNIIRQSMNDALYLEIEPLKGLKIRSQVSLYMFNYRAFRFEPNIIAQNSNGAGGYAYRSENTEVSILSENTVSYAQTFNKKHHFDVMGGFTGQNWSEDKLGMNGKGYMIDDLKWNNMGGIPDKMNLNPWSGRTQRRRMSLLFRTNYNYDQRFYVTFTARADGASNFAKDHKWGTFMSGALKWNMQKEAFLKDVKWIDELSIRASAGRTGNDAISAYRSLAKMDYTTNGYLFGDKQPVAFYRSQIASEGLTWETTDMYTVGLDLSLLKNRINFTFDAYISKTKDLLLTVQRPSQTGFNNRFMNIGRTSNKGVEFSVETRNIVHPNFSWTTSLTASHNSQMVDDIGSEDFVSVYNSFNTGYRMYGYVDDQPLNALWGFKYGGTWKSTDEVDRNKVTKAYVSASRGLYTPGAPRYLDINHDGALDSQDIVYQGNADPAIYGGLQNTFNLYGFSLGIYLNYSIGGKIYNIAEQFMGNNSTFTNQYSYMLKAWHPLRNPTSNIPRANTLDYIPSDRMVHDATFLRLKNVSIGYTFNLEKVTHKILRDLKLSVSGDNLYLWKRYNGFDPEVSSKKGNSELRRLDLGGYPKPRTIIFSLQLRY